LSVNAASLSNYFRFGNAKRVHSLADNRNCLIYRRRSYRSIDSIHPRLEDHAGAALQIKTKTDLGRSLKEYG
jgi:hypothetical protein